MAKNDLTELRDWSPTFLFDLALGFDSPEVVCANHDVSPERYARYMADSVFRAELNQMQVQQRVEGKFAQVLAGAMLDELGLKKVVWVLNNAETDPETILKAVTKLEEMAGRTKAAPVQAAPTFSMTMNFDKPTVPVGSKSMTTTLMPELTVSD